MSKYYFDTFSKLLQMEVPDDMREKYMEYIYYIINMGIYENLSINVRIKLCDSGYSIDYRCKILYKSVNQEHNKILTKITRYKKMEQYCRSHEEIQKRMNEKRLYEIDTCFSCCYNGRWVAELPYEHADFSIHSKHPIGRSYGCHRIGGCNYKPIGLHDNENVLDQATMIGLTHEDAKISMIVKDMSITKFDMIFPRCLIVLIFEYLTDMVSNKFIPASNVWVWNTK